MTQRMEMTGSSEDLANFLEISPMLTFKQAMELSAFDFSEEQGQRIISRKYLGHMCEATHTHTHTHTQMNKNILKNLKATAMYPRLALNL